MNPLRNVVFRKLFTAQVIALTGTGLSTVALTLLAYDLAGGKAGAVLGTAFAVKMVAYVVFAPIVGGVAHRLPRRLVLVGLDIVRAGTVILMPFVAHIWQVYLLIFVLNLFSAGFKPIFQATIPDILPVEKQYTRALSYARLAYDLESLLSPLLAGLALLVFTYTALFAANAVAFLLSAALILLTVLPEAEPVERPGTAWAEISFGVRGYLKTPRLRGLLALYLGVACASAMVIVNTVVYIREYLGLSEADTALALAAAGGGSMLAALSLPAILGRIADRRVMLSGSLMMAAGLGLMAMTPDFQLVLPVWFFIGMGWSLVQTPAGRVVNRSAAPGDRPAYFSAQFALSHACWLLAYPLAGQLGARLGIGTTAILMAVTVLLVTVLGGLLWPAKDPSVLLHSHAADSHRHIHRHDEHHRHAHEGWEGTEPHSHQHDHQPLRHRHPFVVDDHHAFWPAP